MSPPRGVLVARPEPGGAETARRVAALGWTPVLAPALVLAPRPFTIPYGCQKVLLASRAAARALPAPVPGLSVLAVGEATAAEARARGWPAEAAAGTAEDMVRIAGERLAPDAGPLLLAVGQGYSLELAAALRRLNFRVIRRVAYVARPATELPETALCALREGVVTAALFHSPRSATCAITLLRSAGLAAAVARMEALAISRRVAEAAIAAARPFAFAAVRFAARPEEEELMRLLGRPGEPDAGGRACLVGEP